MRNKVLGSIISITWLLFCTPTVTTDEETYIDVDTDPGVDVNVEADVSEDEEAEVNVGADTDVSIDGVDSDEYEDSDGNINADEYADSNRNENANEYSDRTVYADQIVHEDESEDGDSDQNEDTAENIEPIDSTLDQSIQTLNRFVRKLNDEEEDSLQGELNPSFMLQDSLEGSNDFDDSEDSRNEQDEHDQQDWTVPSFDTSYRRDVEEDENPPDTQNTENIFPIPTYSPDTENFPPEPIYPPTNINNEPPPPPPVDLIPINIIIPSPSNIPADDDNFPRSPDIPFKIQLVRLSPNPNFRFARTSLSEGPDPEDEEENRLQDEPIPNYALVQSLGSADDYYSQNTPNMPSWNFPVFATSLRKADQNLETLPDNDNMQSVIPLTLYNRNDEPSAPQNQPPENPQPTQNPQPQQNPQSPQNYAQPQQPDPSVPPPNPGNNTGIGGYQNLPPLDHKPVRTPLSIFDKIKQMEGCEPPVCTATYAPVCSVSDDVLSVYKNECELRETKKINPLREYKEISHECCMIFVKYGTVPQLNVK